jgi:MFS family permease
MGEQPPHLQVSLASARVLAGAGTGEECAAPAAPDPATSRTPVSPTYIWFLVLAGFGNLMAVVTPGAISLSLRVQEIAPHNVEVLGYIVGAGAAVAAVSQPLLGMWSDRTRSRLGRRRPFAIGGAVLGFVALVFVAWAPTVPLLVAGWAFAMLGWTSAQVSLLFSQADRLPEEQRGKVSGLYGVFSMIAPVGGVMVASWFVGSDYLVFLVPGAVGLLLMLLWALVVREPSSRDADFGPRLTLGKVLANMVFNPARYPDFAWNWLGRLAFSLGVTFATTFTTLFLASRLTPSGRVADLGALVPVVSIIAVVATAVGAFAGGFLSDKLRRRRIFVLLAGLAYTVGAFVMALGGAFLPVLVVGSFIANLGLGVFASVDQAVALDVLPEKDTEAGRFTGIIGYSTSVAQAVAPVIAVPLLTIGATDAERNYGLLLLVAAGCTLIGGTIVTWKVRGVK